MCTCMVIYVCVYVCLCTYIWGCKFIYISISESLSSGVRCILNVKALGCLHNPFYSLLINSQNLYEGLEVFKMDCLSF